MPLPCIAAVSERRVWWQGVGAAVVSLVDDPSLSLCPMSMSMSMSMCGVMFDS